MGRGKKGVKYVIPVSAVVETVEDLPKGWHMPRGLLLGASAVVLRKEHAEKLRRGTWAYLLRSKNERIPICYQDTNRVAMVKAIYLKNIDDFSC